ncbi:hypothetical protein JZ751_016845 [Albula glossodonta]|uniref:C2 domain-containing protein n=1 Tax=Albula glossodonta TaxID=121402 RepID=A0A8T2NND6_9TELE|nr:hypothetical protein JZ751_016845 [Albula glossodonta]
MQFCGNKLDKKDFFGKSDPFLVFYRSNEDGTFTICHKTEVVKNTLNPVWQAFKIPVRALCNGDYDRTIKIEVYDWDRDGRSTVDGRTVSHDFIGEFTTSYRELSRGQSQFNVYEVINPKKKAKKKKYLNSGTVTLLSFLVEMEVTFLDYIKGGRTEETDKRLIDSWRLKQQGPEPFYHGQSCVVDLCHPFLTQINFTVAIDFTASNAEPEFCWCAPLFTGDVVLCAGNPAQPTSLHYMSPYQLNAYAMALKAVGEIIQDYDSDKMFPALGFGAKLPPDGRVSHEFALLRKAAWQRAELRPLLPTETIAVCWQKRRHPSQSGLTHSTAGRIDGVMEAYYQSLKSVHLYGPTNFSPVINHPIIICYVPHRYAASVKDGSQYFILLIITDGVISDMAQTKESIVNAACLPMSIIIVGVGPAEFDAMVELDGDEVRVSSRGRYAERDIVQVCGFFTAPWEDLGCGATGKLPSELSLNILVARLGWSASSTQLKAGWSSFSDRQTDRQTAVCASALVLEQMPAVSGSPILLVTTRGHYPISFPQCAFRLSHVNTRRTPPTHTYPSLGTYLLLFQPGGGHHLPDSGRVTLSARESPLPDGPFVPFRDYVDRTGNHVLSMARLAKDVLAEIPDQFLSYMKTRGFKPLPAPPPYTPPGQPLQTQI